MMADEHGGDGDRAAYEDGNESEPYGPKFTMESKILFNRGLPQGLKPFSFGPL